jgi:uncharacterized protein with ParB-like and HNH nuclease domain
LKTISEIFDKQLFRIPDYQRGYSWREVHLDDFWQDLQNLQLDKRHYTGAITLEHCNRAVKKFKSDEWLIKSQKYTPYYVVDGQQRLTTIIILLHELIDSLNGNSDSFGSYSKKDLTEKYLYKSNKNKNLQTFIFGYEIDDPSYEYLKTKIFRQESTSASTQPETSYTHNLGLCKSFFSSKLSKLGDVEKRSLFKKVSELLVFDIKFIEELDKFVVFETMNNRGKVLTNLEKLKNRFIYLSTLIPGIKDNEAEQLRKEVNEVWKSCYEFLGKNKSHSLNDDIFLRNHFVIYHYFNKEKGFPFKQIFKEIYTVENTLKKALLTRYKELRKYVNSLQKAAKQWYIINNPEHALNNELIGIEECKWLIKVNRLGIRVFGPLTLSVYMTTYDETARVKYLKALEAFIFLNYLCGGRRATWGNAHFSTLATKLYNHQDDRSTSSVADEIINWTYGKNGNNGEFSVDQFLTNIKDQFRSSKKNGYYDWSGIKYFLFEFDDYLRGKEKSKVSWTTPDSIEHIYPQTPVDKSWQLAFKGFTEKQKRILCNSLGNLVLLDRSKNSNLSNRAFSYKKEHTSQSGKSFGGYKFGSHSEIYVAKENSWNPKRIYYRGLKMLDFFQDKWKVELTRNEMKTLLLVDDSLMKKIR